MERRWVGELVVGDRWACWTGKVGDARIHSHFAAQAVRSADRVVVEAGGGRKVEGPFVLIDPLAPHRLLPCANATILFVEPGPVLDDAFLTSWAALKRNAGGEPACVPGAQSFWSGVCSGRTSGVFEPRLVQAFAIIDARLPLGRIDLAEVAAPLGLSGERFRRVFADKVGLPFSRYVLWRRLRLAVLALKAGDDATTAAHTAGFADLPPFRPNAEGLVRHQRRRWPSAATQAWAQPLRSSGAPCLRG
jgi:AraC-like DNA-binding protein